MTRQERFEMLFGFIESERTKKGMSKKELCEAANISESTYSRALNGKCIIDVDIYFRLIDAMDISFEYYGKILNELL